MHAVKRGITTRWQHSTAVLGFVSSPSDTWKTVAAAKGSVNVPCHSSKSASLTEVVLFTVE